MAKKRKPNKHGGARPGAGRKPVHVDPVLIAARMSRALCQKLDAFAAAKGMSRSAALAEAIRRLKV